MQYAPEQIKNILWIILSGGIDTIIGIRDGYDREHFKIADLSIHDENIHFIKETIYMSISILCAQFHDDGCETTIVQEHAGDFHNITLKNCHEIDVDKIVNNLYTSLFENWE